MDNKHKMRDPGDRFPSSIPLPILKIVLLSFLFGLPIISPQTTEDDSSLVCLRGILSQDDVNWSDSSNSEYGDCFSHIKSFKEISITQEIPKYLKIMRSDFNFLQMIYSYPTSCNWVFQQYSIVCLGISVYDHAVILSYVNHCFPSIYLIYNYIALNTTPCSTQCDEMADMNSCITCL